MKTLKGKFLGADVVAPFEVFDSPLCMKVVDDIFSGITYPIVDHVKDVKIIVDVGANIGAASVFFAASYPKSKVYSFEPEEECYNVLERNTLSFENIWCFNCGLYSEERVETLYKGKQDLVESSVIQSSRVVDKSQRIKLSSASKFLTSLLQGVNIDVLKIDTEGCEVAILTDLHRSTRFIKEIKLIYVEYHSEEARRRIDDLLAATHHLWRGSITQVHRGEFCYIRKDLIPSTNASPELDLFFA